MQVTSRNPMYTLGRHRIALVDPLCTQKGKIIKNRKNTTQKGKK